MKIIDNIPVWGTEVDQGALSQIKTCKESGAVHVALMADHHKGYSCPIGGVVAYENAISPSVVGYDIGCGNKAILTDASPEDVKKNISKIMDDVVRNISFGVGRDNNTEVDHPLFYDDPAWGIIPEFKDLARTQLGTIGSGNHYVDIFEDEQNRIWVGCHFGSRGLGHKTASLFLEICDAQDGMDVPPLVISSDDPIGSDYIACMNLAGRYAYAGRDWVCSEVARILQAKVLDEVHNHHNFAWKEVHGERELWVGRKGATPAFPGQRGFVGGSMGEMSVILEGVISVESKFSLFSTVHGAGRVMGRMEAKGKYKQGKCLREGKVSQKMMDEWVKSANVELRGAGVDESPHCYKRLPEVLAEHSNSIKILHTLKPLGVAMAGNEVRDPYKD